MIKRARNIPDMPRELDPTELRQVSGGEITSPRDPSTGIPTGRPSHKPGPIDVPTKLPT